MGTRSRGYGCVALIGAGPGDPELITIKGSECLRRADVVVYDRLVAPELVAKAPRRAKRIYVGKEPGKPFQQQRINALLIREARRGKRVVRLKGGDPFLFGRGGEEAVALAGARIPCEVVPGVTSALAVPASAGIPVTHRALASSVSLFTGHEDPTKHTQHRDWRYAARGRGTLVFLMGVAELARLVRELRRAGRAPTTPCAVIASGTLPQQRTVTGTLATIHQRVTRARLTPPAVVVVGEVVRLRDQLDQPLVGRRILVTRPADRASAFAQLLEAAGAAVVRLPTVVLQPLRDERRIHAALRELARYHWLLFTSTEGVDQFMRHVHHAHGTTRVLRHLKIGAIGTKTAEAIERHGLGVACVPKAFHQEGLLKALRRYAWRRQRVLVPRALQARMVLPEQLRRWGAQVDVLPLYEAQPAPGLRAHVRRLLRQEPMDVVTFTSSQCVEHFLHAVTAPERRRLLRRAAVASIGPVTSRTARALGLRVTIEPPEATIPAFVEAITAWARS